MEKMQVRFERCKGCGLCVTVCPKQIVALQKNTGMKGIFHRSMYRPGCVHQLCDVCDDVSGLCNFNSKVKEGQ